MYDHPPHRLTSAEIVRALVLGVLLTIAAAGILGGVEAGASALQADSTTDESTAGSSDVSSAADGLSIGHAVLLGAVEGLTEYLPVSSTGHLLMTGRLLDIGVGDDKDATDSYTVIIQIGAILAVLGIYRQRLLSMANGVIGRSAEGRQTAIAVILAFLPFAVLGTLAGDAVKEYLLSPTPVAITWLVGGVVILVFTRLQSRLTEKITSVSQITVGHALTIGAVQTLALIPGTSRSLVTILAGMTIGLSMSAAVEFSFLLGFVTLSSATAYEILSNGTGVIDTFGIAAPLVGIAVAAVSAFVSVRVMIDWLNRRGRAIFGRYRIVVGVAALVLIGADQI